MSEVLNDAAAATSLRGLEGWYLQRYADQYGYKLVTDTTRVKVKVADWRATDVWRGFGAGVGPFGNLLKGSQSLANASPTL